ncbi:hypothetical protein [Bacillus haynesii]|uniref:hypothetical protein n=1 Tax=Bacillus haynesii TaxID=1925021 RepID=UPI001F604013|nr:hypothetical protein [Bacillus haynesii]MCI4128197.1 hypothetical protein [Bacillus haynesii]
MSKQNETSATLSEKHEAFFKEQKLIKQQYRKLMLKNCMEFLAWAEENKWSEEQIYYVSRIALALLDSN